MKFIRALGRKLRVALAASVLSVHPVLVAVLFAMLAAGAVLGAVWQGARPHVVALGSDLGLALLVRIRKRLGLPPER